MQKMHTAAAAKPITLYSLDVIVSVGYQRRSYAVRVAVQSGIHPAEKAPHLTNRPDWDQLDPVLVVDDFQLLTRAESQSFPDLLRYDDLELWRDSYLSHVKPPLRENHCSRVATLRHLRYSEPLHMTQRATTSSRPEGSTATRSPCQILLAHETQG